MEWDWYGVESLGETLVWVEACRQGWEGGRKGGREDGKKEEYYGSLELREGASLE